MFLNSFFACAIYGKISELSNLMVEINRLIPRVTFVRFFMAIRFWLEIR